MSMSEQRLLVAGFSQRRLLQSNGCVHQINNDLLIGYVAFPYSSYVFRPAEFQNPDPYNTFTTIITEVDRTTWRNFYVTLCTVLCGMFTMRARALVTTRIATPIPHGYYTAFHALSVTAHVSKINCHC